MADKLARDRPYPGPVKPQGRRDVGRHGHQASRGRQKTPTRKRVRPTVGHLASNRVMGVRPLHSLLEIKMKRLVYRNLSVPDRFWKRVERLDNGCWRWLGRHDEDGYPLFTEHPYNGWKWSHRAQRFSYLLHYGFIPEQHETHHKCFNRGCVNPEHLEALTTADHNKITHFQECCYRGHPLSGENLLRRSDGRRACKTCKRLNYSERKRKK